MSAPQSSISPLGFDFSYLRRYRFEFQALDPIDLPSYSDSGSAWRGLLGHGLRRTVCVTRQKTCAGCLLQGSCAYSLLFESPALGSHLQDRTNTLPHPFVISPPVGEPHTFAAGETLWLDITLLGRGLPLLPYLITTEEGAERARLSLLSDDPGWFHRLCADYGLQGVQFDATHIHVLKDARGDKLEDIRTPEDNECAAENLRPRMQLRGMRYTVGRSNLLPRRGSHDRASWTPPRSHGLRGNAGRTAPRYSEETWMGVELGATPEPLVGKAQRAQSAFPCAA